MTYGAVEYAGGPYAGPRDATPVTTDTETTLSVEAAFTTGALETPVWVDITSDVRSWDVSRGRSRELERFQPGRATIVLGNLSRQYDSVYAAGPHFGDVRPMRRIRIRETFNSVTYPVFDGFVDRWQLDYPDTGKDATATVTATDAFKVFNRTDLDRSVYTDVVADDAPIHWYRLDEPLSRFRDNTLLDSGAAGPAGNGSYTGTPKVGEQTLIVNDAGSSLFIVKPADLNDAFINGGFVANAALDLLAQPVFTVEAWCRTEDFTDNIGIVWGVSRPADVTAAHAACGRANAGAGTPSFFTFQVINSAFTLIYGVRTPDDSVVPGQISHVVCVVEADGQMAIYLNGVRYTTIVSGATATSLSGITRPSGGNFVIGYDGSANGTNPFRNWTGSVSEVAVYFEDLGATRISNHLAAGTEPWKNDQPGVRLGRILDEAEWPAALREVDAGDVALQSAELGTAALEHLQKVAETEFGLLFVDRAGNVRFDSRAATFGRLPGPAVYGDLAGEIGYRQFVPDDGDDVIRNRATISRLNGVAQTIEDAASVDEFGRFTYVLDGLLHQSDVYSGDYAEFIASEYKDPRRRITSLALGPAITGDEDILYPEMLGRELGDVITVRSRPVGGGALFQQTCAIEGMSHSGAPGGIRESIFVLSPDFTPPLWLLGVTGRSELGQTTRLGF